MGSEVVTANPTPPEPPTLNTTGPYALVVGGEGPTALFRTLKSLELSPERIWCAPASESEQEAAAGLARSVTYEPWPGKRSALVRLVQQVAGELGASPVVVASAGTLFNPKVLAEAQRLAARGAGLVVCRTDETDSAAAKGAVSRFGKVLSRALVRAGSGMVIKGDVLVRLVEHDWFAGAELPVETLRSLAGEMRFTRAVLRHTGDGGELNRAPGKRLTVTVLIAAYNEQAWIGDTMRSLRKQTRAPEEVVVIDDCSTDRTAEVARHFGARVMRTPTNCRKAAALNLGLSTVTTDVIVTIDADTVLRNDAVERLMTALEDGKDAACGAVFPASERGIWARGRTIEYAIAFRLLKRAQSSLGHLWVLSGCIAAFRTEVIKEAGYFSSRTACEDIDMTWTLDQLGYKIAYVPGAVSYPVEPQSWPVYKAQVRRWASAYFQSLQIHWRTLPRHPGLLLIILPGLLDFLVAFPILLVSVIVGVLGNKDWLLYVLAWQLLSTGLHLVVASSVIGLGRTILSAPGFVVTSYAQQYLFLESFVREIVLRKRLTIWVKGH